MLADGDGFVRRSADRDRVTVSHLEPCAKSNLLLPLVLPHLSYGTRTVPVNLPLFVKRTAALEALNNTGCKFPVN